MPKLTETSVEKVSHRGRETATHLLTAANLSIRTGPEGELVIELFDEDARSSYRWTLGAEDRDRLRKVV